MSNTTPNEGDIITVSTKFERTSTPVEWIQAVKDLHPSCLTYVSGNTSNPEIKPDYVRVTGNWDVYPNINPKSRTFEFSYRVGADCDRGVPLATSMHYGGSLGSGTYSDKGPAITVSKNVTTTTLAAVPGPVTSGQSVTLTATVTKGAQGDSVDFFDGATKVGSGALNGSGVATLTWTPTTSGARSLQAKYLGTAKANPSESSQQPVSVVVQTSMTVSAPATALTGTAVTLSANVTPSNASGTVQFKDNGANIGSPVAVTNGVATTQYTFTTAGNRSITAEFTGAGFATATSAPQPVAVNNPDVQTTASLQVPSTAETGTPVILTANLTPANASGSVQFKDGASNIGSPVTVASGKAQLSHTFTEAGNHSISAVFTGSPGFLGSTAPAKSVIATDPQVPDVQTDTAVTVPATAQTGSAVALSAAVSPADVSGTVQFKDGNDNIGSSVSVVNGVAALQHTFTETGSHSITAVFTGGAGFSGSTSTAQSVQVSDPAPGDVVTSTALTAPATATQGQQISLSARVTSSGALTGTVQFYDGATPVGAAVALENGVAVLPHTFNAIGAHQITAVYSGGTGSQASTSAPQTVQVAAGGGDGGGGMGSLGSLSGFGS
ncbi:Ig-like domain-containing protein [Rhodococcus sp. OK519]|uniref:Ig-like domain-containing protein n=1 Tax=Rhodococcus sp. OK519 TaxID=2135729 RepID=UPI002158BA89